MLLLHVRTVAFLASVSTTIQCALWIIGFILYIIAYECGYDTDYFETSRDAALPTDFKHYYVWYLQGHNCTASQIWMDEVRKYSSSLIVTLISIGFVWNIILLSSSIYMLVGFYRNSGTLGLKLKIFAYSVFGVSLWDLILVIIVSVDFAPLLDEVHYEGQKKSFNPKAENPSLLALPYFSEVFTVIIMLLSRLILFWILNLFFASYILTKDANESARANQVSSLTIDTRRNNLKADIFRDNNQLDKPSTQERRLAFPTDRNTNFAQDRLERQITSPVDDSHEEVKRRWIMTDWQQQENQNNVTENNADYEDLGSEVSHSNQTNSVTYSEKKWYDTDIHNRDNNVSRVSNEGTILSSSRQEGYDRLDRSPPRLQSKTSLSKARGQSFSRKPLPKTPPLTEEERPSANKNGFRYFTDENPFGVKLRHVPRETDNSPKTDESATEKSNSSVGEVNPYLVSSLCNLDPNYEPRDFFQASPQPSVSPSYKENKKTKSALGPPPPPPKHEPSASLHLNHQMSLEEAIRTRRPLRPINRPSIDTNC